MKKYLIFFLLLFSKASFAQQFQYDIVDVFKTGNNYVTNPTTGVSYLSNSVIKVNSVDYDPYGNLFFGGETNRNFSVGFYSLNFLTPPFINTANGNVIVDHGFYFGKKNIDGLFAWAGGIKNNLSTSQSDFIVKSDNNGNLFVTGWFEGTIDLDWTSAGVYNLTAEYATSYFIAKYSNSGQLIWGKAFGGDNCVLKSMNIATDGSIYFGGYFSGTFIDFDPGINQVIYNHSNRVDSYIFKINGNGDYVWSKILGSPAISFTLLNRIAIGNDDEIYATGIYTSPGGIEGTTINSTNGGGDVFFLKYNKDGVLQWSKNIGSTADEQDRPVIVADTSGNFYITFLSAGNIDVDPSPTNVVVPYIANSPLILKYDRNANFLWQKQLISSSTGSIIIQAIDCNQQKVFVRGMHNLSFDADSDPTKTTTISYSGGNTWDVFCAVFDKDGNCLQGFPLSSTGYNSSASIAQFNGTKFVMGGEKYGLGSLDFDPSTAGNSGHYFNAYENYGFLAQYILFDISQQPVDVNNCNGNTTDYNFKITTKGAIQTYNWQVDKNDGNGFENIIDDTTYYGTTTNSLSLRYNKVNPSMNGYKYRCVINQNTITALSSTSASLAILNKTIISVDRSTCQTNLPYNWNGIRYNGPGVYQQYAIQNSGCVVNTLNLTVNQNPEITTSASKPSICLGDTVTLSASGASTYLWMPGSISGQSITVTPAQSISYSVTGTDTFGCSTINNISTTKWRTISAGGNHSLAIKSDGTLWAWGNNSNGQLGIGTTSSSNSPVQVGTDNNWESVSAGAFHSLAIKSDGTLWSWGINSHGQLGNGTNITSISTRIPVQVGTGNNWKSVTAGARHSLAVKSNGTLWAWGSHQYGQLGIGVNTSLIYLLSLTPLQVGADNNWELVSAGANHSIAIKTDGTLWAWGINDNGQLGIRENLIFRTPILVGTDNNWKSVSAGAFHSLAIKSDGTLWATGYNSFGQLGNGSSTNSNTFSQIGVTNNWKSVSAGYYHSSAIKTDGTLWAWGENSFGQQGNSTTIISSTPTQSGTANFYTTISTGNYHSLAISSDSTILSWGYNAIGQLGNGTYSNNKTPTNLPSVIKVNLPTTSTSDSSICLSQFPFVWNGVTFNTIGTQTAHLINANGCDSAATLNLSLKQNSYSTTNVSICASQFPYLWNNNSYNTAGIYQSTLTNVIGCDSIATLQLNLKPSSSSTTNVSICPSQSPYIWNGTSYNTSGTYSYITTNVLGCDSIAILSLNIKSNTTSTTTITICPSQFPYTWNGKTCTMNGTYLVHLTNAQGCDSAATLVLKSSLLICGYSIPTPQNLPYTQNFGTTAFSTPFAGMIGWVGSGSRPFGTQANAEASLEGADQTISATVPVSSGAGGLYGHVVSSNALLTLLQSANSTSGTSQVVLAVKTTGYNSVTISYDLILTIANPRSLGLSLQYRVGNTGPFSNIPSSAVIYNSTSTNLGTLDGPTNVDRYTFSLPIAALDKPEVEFRWVSWRPSGSGNSSGISIDNISVTGTIGCLSPSINTQPSTVDKSVCFGNDFEDSLTVTAYGTSLSYQWYKNSTASNSNGTLITSATNSSYTPPANTIGVNYYYCQISNSCNSIKTDVSGAYIVNSLPIINADIDRTICNNDTISISNNSPNANFIYSWTPNEKISNASIRNPLVYPSFNTTYVLTQTSITTGCFEKDTVIINVKQKSSSITDITTCSNQLPFIWNNQSYQNQGLFLAHFTNANGCDSTALLNLIVKDASYSSTNISICANQTPYLWNGIRCSNSGVYVYTTSNSVGCDSIATLNLIVKPTNNIQQVINICRSELPYIWDGDSYQETGNYIKSYTNALGCDSTVMLILNVVENSHNTQQQTDCDTFNWHDSVYTTSGIYTFNYLNSNSCESVDTLFLTINNSSHNHEYVTACTNYNWHDSIFTSSGIYTFNYENGLGCLSTDTLHLIINYATNQSETIVACETYIWHGVEYTTSGTYTYSYQNEFGCYSVDTLHLTVNYSTHNLIDQTACESYVWHGIEYFETGKYLYYYVNEMGCASTDTLNLIINHGSHLFQSITACEAYVWHNITYSISGLYTYDYLNEMGCPSIDTLDLIINQGTHFNENKIACDQYTWHGANYSTSGIYTYSYFNTFNCYSVDTLHLTINYSSQNFINQTACESFDWHGQTYTTSGIYTWIGENALGCDSMVNLNLTINNSTSSTNAIQALNTFNWHGNNYNQTGIYSFTTTNAFGCDSIAILDLLIYPCTTTYSTSWDTICNSALPYLWNGISIMDSGRYQKLLVNQLGCDSIAILNLAFYNFNPIISISNNTSSSIVCKANPEMITYNISGCNNCSVDYNIYGLSRSETSSVDLLFNGQGHIYIMPDDISSNAEHEITVELYRARDNATGCISNAFSVSSTPLQVIQSFHSSTVWNFSSITNNGSLLFTSSSEILQGNNNGISQMINTNAVSNGYVGASGGGNAGLAARTGAFNESQSGYFEFRLTNDSGYNFVLNEISFGTRSTSTGPKSYLIRSSIDNFTTNIDSGSIQNNSNWSLIKKSGIRLSGLGNNNPVTVRIYGINGIGNASLNTINWRIDDLKLDITEVQMDTVVSSTNQYVCGSLTSNPLNGILPLMSSGTWTQISGPGTTNFSNTNDKNAIASVSAYGYYVYKWSVESSCTGHKSSGQIAVNFLQDRFVENYVACDSFVWHGVTYYNSISTPIYTINNPNGCDSIFQLNLVINKSSNHTDTVSICNYQLPYHWNGGAYTTSGIYTKVISNSIGCDSTITLHLNISNCNVVVNIKAFLEGYYLGNNLMESTLYDLGISSNSNETDSIEIDLWAINHLSNSAPDYKMIAVINNDGSAFGYFPLSILGGSYYIALRHRSSIEVWSKNPILISLNNFYDFTLNINGVYSDGFNDPMKSIGNGLYGLYSGDLNQDGSIDIFDMQIAENDAAELAFGYNSSDCSGDGSTDLNDMQLIENNANLYIFIARP